MAGNELDQPVRQPSSDHRPQNHRSDAAGTRDQECQGDTWQHAVTDGVAQQGHPPQDEEVADQPTRRTHEKCHQSHEPMAS